MEEKKRLCKVKDGKKICGVCAGVAKFLNTDPTYIRLAWALFVCLFGTGILAYFICAFILPDEEEV